MADWSSAEDFYSVYQAHYEEELERNPHRCELWLEYARKLKSLCPSPPPRYIRYASLSKLVRNAQASAHDTATESHDMKPSGDTKLSARGSAEFSGAAENPDTKLSADKTASARRPSRAKSASPGGNGASATTAQVLDVYRRALCRVPLSYKTWYAFLRELVLDIPGSLYECPELYSRANQAFETCLVHLYATPAIYLLYTSFLRLQNRIARTHKIFDRALLCLPVTQHELIWEEYTDFVTSCGLLPLGKAVFPRLIQVYPGKREVYYEFLCSVGAYEEACRCLCALINDSSFVSQRGKSQHEFWGELCQIIRGHGHAIRAFPAEEVIRQGIAKYTDQVAALWVTLAEMHAGRGDLELARSVYQEAIASVATAEDFAVVFDCYARHLVRAIDSSPDGVDDSADRVRQHALSVARLEYLVENRAFLLFSARLRQNPHSVDLWVRRAGLFTRSDPARAAAVFGEAVRTVDFKLAKGRFAELWTRFAALYEAQMDFAGVEKVFELAVKAEFASTGELASVWCAWVETYLRHGDHARALGISRRAVNAGRGLCYSPRLWMLALDLEENFGTMATAQACYERMLELRVASPAVVSKFCRFLASKQCFEACFRAYERGIALFQWPQLYPLYLEYISCFTVRFLGSGAASGSEGRRLERAREIFHRAIGASGDPLEEGFHFRADAAPPEFARPLLYLYASLEEEFGLARRAVALYRLAAKVSPPSDKLRMFRLYICKTAELFGVLHTRDIYTRALQDSSIDDGLVRHLAMQFIALERGLGEVDRARAVYVYAAQFFDPADSESARFWDAWKEFEILHGNHECFRDMLRLKTSVAAQHTLRPVLI